MQGAASSVSRTRFRIAAIVTAAVLSAPMITLVTQDHAWATLSRSNSPDRHKTRANAPTHIEFPKATLPTSVTQLTPGSPVWISRWDGTASHISIRVMPNGEVSVFDINRDKKSQPPGSAGHMIASSLREIGALRPPAIRVDMINNPPTTEALKAGRDPDKTVIGEMVRNAARELGGDISGWELPAADVIKANITYRSV